VSLTPVQITPTVFANISGSGTLTCTFGSNTTPGNSIVVIWASGQTTTNPTISGITIGGNAEHFGSAESLNNNAQLDAEIWLDSNLTTASTSVVVSFSGGTGSGSFAECACAYEVPGILTTDKVAGGTNASTTWDSGATAATTQAAEILFGSAAIGQSQVPTVTGVGSWTTVTAVPATNCRLIGGYQIVAATGAAEFKGTVPTSTIWTTVVATFSQASGGIGITGQRRAAYGQQR
jgi:hypothetical protein